MADEEGAAVSGGLLVVLGIVVAAGLGFFFLNGDIGGPAAPSGPDISVNLPATGNTGGNAQ